MNSINVILNKVGLALLVFLGFFFPLLILPQMTDPFILPKQALVLGGVLLILLLSVLKLLSGQEIRLRRTPFDIPLLGFSLVLVVSSALSVNRPDSIIFTTTFLSLILLYYLVINLLSSELETRLFTLALLAGSALSSVVLILSFAKIYFLTFLFPPLQAGLVQNPAFSPLGNILGTGIFLLILIPFGVGQAIAYFKKNLGTSLVYLALTLVIILGFLTSSYELLTTQKPLLLPQEYGLQAATGAIGQNFQTLLFGSGPATFLTDFSRFRSTSFNNLAIWNTIFFSSSSFFLELLATTGLLGIAFFLFLVLSIVRTFAFIRGEAADPANLGLFVSLVLVATVTFIVPLSFTALFLFFGLLGLYTIFLSRVAPKLVFETKILVINLQEGLGVPSNIVSLLLVGLSLVVVGAGAYFGGRFFLADSLFQKSLFAAAENRGLDTYNLQREAIATSSYRDSFHRIFSQTNLALANSLSQDIRTRNASPSAQEQQTILTLVQQAIDNANQAAILGPWNFLNFDNRATIYRSLIGFGQNAENFAIASLQQAIALNPTNPQLRLSLGGAFYQMGTWDQAQRQFELAVNLKPDFVNAYYNLGHALENKGDLQGALVQYQTVEALLAREAKDSENYKKVTSEIEALRTRISREGATVAAVPPPQPTLRQAQGGQEPLQVSTPSSTLPRQTPKVEIPPPTEATESAK